MTRRTRNALIAAGCVVAIGGAGAGVAIATGAVDDDATETAISGPALDQASRAALAHTGGGKVTGTEVGDEESTYEVEVTKDGEQIDVQLDDSFAVVGTKADKEDAGE